MPEEDAFWALYTLMESPKYFEGYYSENLARIQVRAQCGVVMLSDPEVSLCYFMPILCSMHARNAERWWQVCCVYCAALDVVVCLRGCVYVGVSVADTTVCARGCVPQHEAQLFNALLALELPAVGTRLEALGVHPLMFVTPWFMCAMTSLPRWDTVLAVWDQIVLNGASALLRAAVTIMRECRDTLLALDGLSALLPFLQHLPPAQVVPPGTTRTRSHIFYSFTHSYMCHVHTNAFIHALFYVPRAHPRIHSRTYCAHAYVHTTITQSCTYTLRVPNTRTAAYPGLDRPGAVPAPCR